MNIKQFIFLLLVFPFFIFAQQEVPLPSAGLTPENPFYFLDRLGENLRQFFTFNPEGKARLQIEFAEERIAEIKIIIEKKGVNAKGLAIAESLLRSNVAHAAEIMNKEKIAGKDVAALAKTLNDEFDARDKLLEQTFKDAKSRLKAERKEIKINLLKEARRVGDTAQIALLEGQLNDIDEQIDALGREKNQLSDSLQNEQKKIEAEMDEDDQKKEELEQEQEEQKELEEDLEEMEAEEAEKLIEADEQKEAGEQKETDEKDNKKDNSKNLNSSERGNQNIIKTGDDEEDNE